jgi:phage shock protein PspC (stress-responsive transcriptional regulator)
LGLTVAAPKNRYLSIIGIFTAAICGGIGHYFNTPIV